MTTLEVTDLVVDLEGREGLQRVLYGVSLRVEAGETLGVIGESGSGKTLTALAILGILPSPPVRSVGGRITYRGRDLLGLPESELRAVRGEEIALVFQDGLSALNPVYPVGWQIAESLRARRGWTKRRARARSLELLQRVGIPDPARRAGDYPHQLSGGMRQRAVIAMALALEPNLLVADEPTSALDVTIQAQVIELLKSLQAETGMSLIFISHDLGVVASVSDHIAIMYAGRIVESAPAADFYAGSAHPYGRGLRGAIPDLEGPLDTLDPIPGSPPAPGRVPAGCPFHPRCPHAVSRCIDEVPRLRPIDGYGGLAACHLSEEIRG